MKTLKYLIILAIFSIQSFGQDFCLSEGVGLYSPQSVSTPAFGPNGTLKTLVIICKFSDDNFDLSPNTDVWPHTQNSMPSWGPSLVSQVVSSDYADPSLSGYYQDMSLKNFNIIGDVVYYQPLHEESYYFVTNGRHLGYLTEEILTELNPTVNYANYDNWDPNDFDSDGIKNEPDGKVDMIQICFRIASTYWMDYHLVNPNPGANSYQGIAGLTGFRNSFASGAQLTLDGKVILASLWGSGTFQNSVVSPDDAIEVMAHELGHYLFGGVHYSGISYYGLMDGWGAGVMSPYERTLMGWIQPTVAQAKYPSNYLPDYVTTGAVKRLNYNSNNYFLIANHQKLSWYESSWKEYNGGPLVYKGTGVLISHITPYENKKVDIESSFGKWNWKKTGNLYNYPFEIESTNRISGLDKLDLRYMNTIQGTKSHPDARGAADDFMNPGFFEIFSPWSNPSTYPDASNLCVELVSIDEFKIAHVNLYTQNAYLASPSKPQNPKLSANPGNNYVRLSWERNLESDTAYYEVSRKVTELGGTWQVIGTTTNNYFVDNDFYYSNPVGDFGCTYRLRVKDTQNKFSVYSDEVFIRAEMMGKITVTNESVREYNLDLNYPNPFNPSTIINFAVKDAGLVSLKVYDILGSEVATLVNETKEAGNFAVEFNSANLPSGVYIYTLQVNGFISSKKMLLMK